MNIQAIGIANVYRSVDPLLAGARPANGITCEDGTDTPAGTSLFTTGVAVQRKQSSCRPEGVVARRRS